MMKRRVIGVVLAMSMVMAALCACGNQGASSSSSAAGSSPSAEASRQVDAVAEMKGLTREGLAEYLEGLDDKFAGAPSAYRFTLEGRSYELPCGVSDFLDNGWTLEPGDEFSGGYLGLPDDLPDVDEYASFDVFSGMKQFTLSVVADGASAWEDCTVIAVEYEPEDRADRAFDFELASGAGQDSTVEDVLGIYGRPFSSGVGERDGSAYISSLSYSAAGTAEKAEQIAQEEERKAQAERDGEVYVPSSASVAAGPIFSLRDNYDALEFSFKSDGTLASIKMLNSL